MKKNNDMVDILDFETLQDLVVEESGYKIIFAHIKKWLNFSYLSVFIELAVLSFTILIFFGLSSFII